MKLILKNGDLLVEFIENTEDGFFKGKVIKKDKNLFYYEGQIINDFINDCFKLYREEEPSSSQVGGSHYKDLKIQPTEFIHANNIPFIEGNIIKYIVRHRNKNGVEDLKKAKHYIDLLIQYENEKSI